MATRSQRGCALVFGVAVWLGCSWPTAQAQQGLYAPSTTESASLPAPRGGVVLTIDGAISTHNSPAAAVFDWPMLQSLPQQQIRTRTPWYSGSVTFSGPLLSEVLQRVGAQGQWLRVRALNDYAVDIPVSDALAHQPILAWQVNGQPLSVREKGPLFLVYPFDDKPELKNDLYYGRSIWQIQHIHVR